MTNSLVGKTVFITRASSGFGAAFAHAFASQGARLVNMARRSDRLEELEKQLRKAHGCEVLSVTMDVADIDSVKYGLQHIPEPFSTPDILINNAGLVRGLDRVWEVSADDWNQMIDVNIKGVLNICSQLIPRMLECNSGHIINIGSVSSHETYPGGGVYCATKHAVKAITEALRKELVATPLRVSMISPGMAKTEFSMVRFANDQGKADAVYEGIEALTAADVADIVLFMATRPAHVNIADVIVFPTNQASVSLMHRRSK